MQPHDLEGHVPLETFVPRMVDLTHATMAQEFQHIVLPEFAGDLQRWLEVFRRVRLQIGNPGGNGMDRERIGLDCQTGAFKVGCLHTSQLLVNNVRWGFELFKICLTG